MKRKASAVAVVEDWVTQAEAANLRGVSVNVINNWLARGRLKHMREQFGKRLVSRAEVLSYQPSKGGRTRSATVKGGRT